MPEPLLSPAEAELEAKAFGLGEGEIMGEFGTVDGLELGFYTHAIAITSGPEHLCRYYLVRLAR